MGLFTEFLYFFYLDFEPDFDLIFEFDLHSFFFIIFLSTRTSSSRESRGLHLLHNARSGIFFGTLRLVWMSPLVIEYPPATCCN